MTFFLTLEELLELHDMVIERSGGSPGLRDRGSLESCVAQPCMGFGGTEFYPGLGEKAAALAYSLVCNHPFVDGNKRLGHAAMETFLVMNGYELTPDVDEQERMIFRLASGELSREEFTTWVSAHLAVKLQVDE